MLNSKMVVDLAWAMQSQAPRNEEGDRGAGTPMGRVMHRIWVDGTEFRWRRNQPRSSMKTVQDHIR